MDIDGECGILNASIGTISGNIEIKSGGSLTINGDITNVTGSIIVCSSCTLTITGDITDMDGSITNDGTINLSGAITAEGKLELKGSGVFNIDGGSFESTGDGVVIESGSTLNMTNASTITASTGVENEGVINSDNSGNQIIGEVTGGGTVDPDLNCSGAGCDDSILPVDLVYFKSSCADSNLEFTWMTASELNNNFFTLESSTDGNIWSKVGEINGNGTTKESNIYFFELPSIYVGSYYRLTQTDFD